MILFLDAWMKLLILDAGNSSITTIVAIVVPIVVAIALFIVGWYFLRKMASKFHDTIMEDSSYNCFSLSMIGCSN